MEERFFTQDRPLHPFLFMGCWNRAGHRARDAVAAAIQARPESLLVIGGDNIYPEKDAAGKKRYNLAVLHEGFELYKSKAVIAALGNHNVSNNAIRDSEIAGPWFLPTNYYAVKFTDAALIVLDTNIVTIKDKFEEMKAWLTAIVAKLDVPYYIVQHEPYASYKKEKGQALVGGPELFRCFAANPPLAILCADTHNFQKGILKLEDTPAVTQYVVGTGGASPDEIGDHKHTSEFMYELQDSREKYGFAVIASPGVLEFQEVASWNGGHRRTRRRRGRARSRKYKRSA